MPAGMITGLNGRLTAGGGAGAGGAGAGSGAAAGYAAASGAGVHAGNGGAGAGFADETGRYDGRGFGDDDGLTGFDDESETQVLRPQKARGSRRAAARAAKARAAAAGGVAAGGIAVGAGSGTGAAAAGGFAGGAGAPAAGSTAAAGAVGGTTGFAAGFGAPGPKAGARASIAGAPRLAPEPGATPSATSDHRGMSAPAAPGSRSGGSVEKLQARNTRRRKRGWIIFLLIVVLVAVGGSAGWYFSSGPGGHVNVPSVTAQTPADATATLQALGLLVAEPESATSPTVPVGSLIGTDPGDGAAVPNGSAISLIVSAGPAQLTVPPLVGSMQDAATAAVAGLFTVTGSQGQFAGDVAAGTVMQALGADGQPLGATYGEQQPISFVVSLGGIPDVVGKSPADAAAALGAVNLQTTTGSSDYSESIPEGDVISVGLPPSPIVPGNTITLNTSKGPAPVPVPDVAGKNWADAKAALQAAGFTLKYSPYADLAPAAFVVSGTDPAPGTTLDRGSSVAVSFAGF
ncbi:PASTA domain-containing protein [Subtercola boreus]